MSTKTSLRAHLCALLAAPALLAQSPAPAPEKKDDDVLVLSKFEVNRSRDVGYFSSDTTSGTRINMATTDVPGSINIINSQFISDLKATAASELVKYTSGVVQNEHTRDDYIIRGFRQSRVFRDGIECTDFVSNQLYDVDRLEVVKGPVAMVFGNSGVLGGAINYVPRKPTATPQGDLSFAVGAENSYLRSTLNLSGPLREDRKDVRYRLTVGGQNDSREKDIERLNQLFVGGALDMDFGKTTVSLYGYYINNDRFIYFNDFLDTTKTSGDLTLNPRSTREFGPADGKQDLYFDSKELYLTATVLTQLSDNLSFRAFYRYRSDDEPRRIIRGISVAADNVTLNRQILNFPYSEFGQATQVDMTYRLNAAGVTQDISWGADYSNVFSRDVLAIYPITPLNTATLDYSADAALQDQYTINNQNQRTTTEQLSYYIQDFASMWGGKVNLVGGLRWINPRITQRNLLTGVNAIRDDPLKQVHRYGVVFKPLPRVSVYAMQANTFQINTGVNHLGNPLIPSEGKITEVGFKTFDQPLAGGHVFLSGAYFDMALTNVVTVGPLTVVNGQTVNEILQVASDTSKGYEFDLGYSRKVGPGTFDTILTFYNAKPKAASGLRTIRAPKYDYSFFFKYRFDEGALKGFALGLGGSFVGNRLATTNGLFYYPAHETYDAFLQYALDRRWSFSLNVSNLTNTRYVATYAAAGLAGANDGRTTRLSARYAW